MGIMTQAELEILVSVIYLCAFLFLCQLLMALYIVWKFLIRDGKYKTWPLTLFYVLVIWLTILRIYYCIYYFNIWINADIIGSEMKNVLKINIGLVQCWILFEFSLRISESIEDNKSITSQSSAIQ